MRSLIESITERGRIFCGLLAVITCCTLLSRELRGQEEIGAVRFSVALVGSESTYPYTAGQWGIMRLNLVNPRETPAELLVLTSFNDEPTLQFGRRTRVPARSRLETWYPVLVPRAKELTRLAPFHTLALDVTEGNERPLRSETGQLRLESSLPLVPGGQATALISNSGSAAGSALATPDDLVKATRTRALLARTVLKLSPPLLSPGEESLQALDHLVLADDRILADGTGLTAIRRWLYGGGHLWVMLDRVDRRVLDFLLGDELECEVVDRVGLTSVDLQSEGAALVRGNWHTDYESPVDFVRVLVERSDVVYTANGWPAAFWKNCGEGRILVTTLGSHGWLRPPTELEVERLSQPSEREKESLDATVRVPIRFVPTDPMAALTLDFYARRRSALLSDENLVPLTQEYVGYSIPPRWAVLGILVGFTLSLGVCGVVLLRGGRLDRLGIIGPVLAMVATAVLVFMGKNQRSAVPPMAAIVQIVRSIPGADEIRIAGVAGLFSPEVGPAEIEGRRGGWVMPDMEGMQGTTRRLVWTDLDAWRWENLPGSAGLRSAAFAETVSVSPPVRAHATFDAMGLIGRLQLDKGLAPTDALIATREGRIGVELRNDGEFIARADSVFTSEQFLSVALLSDEQNRHRRVFQDLLVNPRRTDYPDAPQLLVWTRPWDMGIQFGENRPVVGAALVAIPLEITRPAEGTEILLPSPFLPFRESPGPDGDVIASVMYDAIHSQWVEKSAPSTTWLSVRIPKELLPVEVEKLRAVVRVTGPIGKFELAGRRQSEAVSLKTWIDPVGELTFEADASGLLPVSETGEMLLRVSGGDPDRPELTNPSGQAGDKRNYWRIESLSLRLAVRTIAPAG